MDNKITGKIKKYNSSHTKRQWLYRALSIVAAFAVFCTTYVLILPAITLDSGTVGHRHDNSCYAYSKETKKLTCPVTVHEHEDKCFDENDLCICGYSDFIVHTHDEMCYDEDKNLLCNMSEIAVHEHTDECYSIKDKELICEEADSHEHTDECYTPQEKELICEKDEIVLHTHTEECIDENSKIICEKTEIKEHQHTEDCFTIEITAYDEPILICGLEEYTRTAKDCAAEFAKLVKDMPDSSEKEYFDAYYTAYDAYSLALDMYYEENPYDGQDDFDEWLKELGYFDEFEKFTEMPVPDSIATYAAATSAAQTGDITRTDIEGIDFKLFNYGLNINAPNGTPRNTFQKYTGQDTYYYFSFRGENDDSTGTVTNGVAGGIYDEDPFTINHSMVEPTLLNGFPVLDFSRDAEGNAKTATSSLPSNLQTRADRSLQYLFTAGDAAVTAYDPSNTILNTDGKGRYWYNSADNAVDYDPSSNIFRVRNYTERTNTTATYIPANNTINENGLLGDFLPFNYSGGTVVGTGGDYDYHILATETDYWFGMTMEFDFFQTTDGIIDNEEMVFEFSGDDDIYIFVDDVLVLNLGGTHGTVSGSINFATGEILQYLSWSGSNSTQAEIKEGSKNSFPTTLKECYETAGLTPNGGWDSTTGERFADYSKHTLKFFYMERGGGVANCNIDFKLPVLPNNSLTVGKEIEVDNNTGDPQINEDINEEIKQSLSYKFRVHKLNTDGTFSENNVLFKNTTFKLTEEGKPDSIGTVDQDGVFTLKTGQRALFEQLLEEYNVGDCTFVVEELIPEDLLKQYTGTYSGAVELQQGETSYKDAEGNSYKSFVTDPMTISDNGAAYFTVFQNKVNVDTLSKLKITKSRALGAGFDKDTVFNMNVTLSGEPIPIGTVYKIGNNEYTVQTEGVIPLKAGQTAIIEGILSGTEFRVTEQIADGDNYIVTYSGTITEKGETTNLTAPPNEGTFTLASTVHITVTNADYDFNASIPLLKTTPNFQNGEKAEFTFNVTEVTLNEESGEWEKTAILPDVYIPAEEAVTESNIVVGYSLAEIQANTIHYYLVEEADIDGYICDKTYYLVKVELKVVDGNYTAESTILERNGEEYTGEKLEFTNYRSAIFTVTKTVTGEAADGIFPFEAIISNKGDFILPEGSNYVIDGNSPNIFTFSLRNGEKFEIELPVGTTINLTETEHTGYIPSYTIDNSTDATNSNVVNSISVPTTGVTVHFNNRTGTVLPSTGGTGTIVYTLGGLLVAGAAGSLLVYKTRGRKRE